jgi:subtilisin family serine protease
MGEPDRIYGLNDEIFNQLKGNQWALSKINAPEAWRVRNMMTKPVIVAIIDTGIRYTHQDLKDNMWTNPDPLAPDHYGINAVAKTGDPMDDCGHGTHCAGIIGATGVGINGIVPQVQLMACKYMDKHGKGLQSDEIACLHYAVKHGANVLNCSYGTALGFSGHNISVSTPFSLFSKSEYDAMKYLGEKGALIAIAAGNSHNLNDVLPAYPASYCVDSKLLNVSALNNIVSVAATDEQDQLCHFSNYGIKSVFLAAPGSNILSTWNYSDTSYTFASGTSMAAPHVAGALALMKAKFPNRSNQELIAHLLESTDPLDSLKGKTKAGRLNLLKALIWD